MIPAIPPAAAPARSLASDSALSLPAVDYLWVPRGVLGDPASVDSVLARAQRMGVRGLLVQIVGRGDAVHRSDLLPRAEFLGATDRRIPGWDPFGALVEAARARGLEIHAWMNCLLVWSAPQRPRDPGHVLNAHPEWVAQLRDGRRLSALSARERSRRGVEGVFLTAAHPGVRDWLSAIAREIVTRYPVDGIHLDYIRHPTIEVGWDETSRARFALEHGVDPRRLGHLAPSECERVMQAWAAFQRDQVTGVVRAVRESALAARPGIAVTAAVIADTLTAERSNAQMWRQWIRDGLLDRAFVMCYAVPVQTVMNQLLGFTHEFGATERVVPGIAVYNTGAMAAALKIKGARALGFPRVALYSYEALFGGGDGWERLRQHFATELP